MKKIFYILSFFAFLGTAANAKTSTLDNVKKNGFLKCGVSTGAFGLSYKDDKGIDQGIDVEYCRALSIAIFGNDKNIKFVPLTTKNRFTSLTSGEIDILSRGTTWTFSRDVDLGVDYAGIILYDGQGFIVKKDSGIKSAKELDGATVCIQLGTTSEANFSEYAKSINIKYEFLSTNKQSDAEKSLNSGRCDVYTTDATGLSATKVGMPNPDQWVILPEIISKEPLGPIVRGGDQKWSDLARWVLNTLISAEELGVSSKNVDKMKSSKNLEVQRLLGVDGSLGEKLGVKKDFGYLIIKKIGNYKEVYERTIALGGLPRGNNKLWTDGGLLYSPPFR